MVHLTGRIEVVVVEARGLLNLDENPFNPNDKSDPYCVVAADGVNGPRKIGKTPTIDDCLNPKWNCKIAADISQDVSGLKFTVKDKDRLSSEVIGTCFIDSMVFASDSRPYSALLHLTSPKGRPAGAIRVQIHFTGSSSSSSFSTGSGRVESVKLRKNSSKTKLSPKLSAKYGEIAPVILHGMLEIFVEKAVHLPNMDTSIFSLKKTDVSDPFIDIVVEDAFGEVWKVATTSVIDNDLNPAWNETFCINVCHEVITVKFIIKDKDVLSADVIGIVTFRAEDLITSRKIEGPFDIYVKGKPKKDCTLSLMMLYKPYVELSSDPEVPGCVFRMRKLNNVTLYQDAHCLGLAPIPNKFGQLYHQPRAWLDLYDAILGAKEFIYIVGWSVNARVSILRWQHEDDRCIGDILIQKANEGVQVVLMIWDELTSTDFNKDGAMGTSDQATAEFFKNSEVSIVLSARDRNTKDISTKQRFTNFCYTHHQKCVIVDGEVKAAAHKRQAIAFIGGLDITNGRFDTPEHPLFDTLNSDHRDDFYNSLILTKPQYGPREPWHDIHCRIEGPATLDLLANFRERWNKQGSAKNRKVSLIQDEDKYKINLRNPERWNTQVFRSINSDSALFEKNSSLFGLSVKKERVFENSIQRAYIHHIRRAKSFLYMENQYFMGSSHEWLECRDAQIENLIPLEIVAHIEDKIKLGERFVAYIVIPMFPEGKPADKVVQEMLHWQFRTIEMMYSKIGNAIREAGIDAHPQDFLLFFCLGKKEERQQDVISVPSDLTGHAANAFKNRRLMIYVHSKMIIFDDEYIIIGSANINDRSMNGNRDTEIAMGAFQPEYMMEGSNLPNGNVSMFRKSLWLEHMGQMAPLTPNPSDVKCVRKIRELAEDGLLSFLDEGTRAGTRHLLLYPLHIHSDGTVTARSDCQTFPDTNASVIGKRSGYIPTSLTS